MWTKQHRLVHRAYGAGRWFPADARRLRDAVRGYIDAAEPASVRGRIVSVLAPHAGYEYSGPVAGHTYRAVRDAAAAGDAPETAIVLGFTHAQQFDGVSFMEGDAFETPLGECELDRDGLADLLNGGPHLLADHAAHIGEHSAENQVPFLQEALPGARLIVGLLGSHSARVRDELTAAIVALARRRRVLLVASTDMLHDSDYARVAATDRATLARLEAMDLEGLLGTWGYANQILCGIGPVAVALAFAAAQGCRRGTRLCYRNSGDDHPESRGHWVVGYGAVAYAVAAA